MAEKSKAAAPEKAETKEAPKSNSEILSHYYSLSDPKERKAYFQANPVLKGYVSALNHP